MENFERVANELIAYINDKERQLMGVITMEGSRFILYGNSGSGKTRAVELANKQLPFGQQIAESHEMLFSKNLSAAENILNDKDIKYQGARHIGFNIVKREIADKLQNKHVKVFWLNT